MSFNVKSNHENIWLFQLISYTSSSHAIFAGKSALCFINFQSFHIIWIYLCWVYIKNKSCSLSLSLSVITLTTEKRYWVIWYAGAWTHCSVRHNGIDLRTKICTVLRNYYIIIKLHNTTTRINLNNRAELKMEKSMNNISLFTYIDYAYCYFFMRFVIN